ncbi:hypothetical protein F5876DRAFT_66189 [Lentinula aff. lateritia]|uniref:Uncharacterized protein n=1 Tax=Lentinula aff. lateritia TaxID=2804960 RepID=A0ACC1TYD2_9AGAR|nr:hypothetical protein F5876DRAFT_66189 [Lentinula aff. lateritia]
MSEPFSATQAPTGPQTAPAGPIQAAPATSVFTPLSNDWSEKPDCFVVCRHTCPHPRANQPGGTLRWAFTFVRNVSTQENEHIKSGKHPHCSQACPEFGQTRRGTEGLRDATIAEKFCVTILYSQAFHGSEVKNKAMLQWYQPFQLFTNFSEYKDIPTQLDQNIRPFNLQAVKAGNPAFGLGTQISTTPLILFGLSMTQLMLTFTFEMLEPQNLRPLQSTWHSQGKELLKCVLFVLSKVQGAKKPLKTLKQADKEVVANFYWCIIQWDLAASYRVQFLHLLEKSIPLQHYMFVDYSVSLKWCDIYLFKWVLEKWELSKYWQLLRGIHLVIGQAELDSSSIPRQKIYTGDLAKMIKVITVMGIRIWPESEVDHFTCKKFALYSLLASTIEKAGGLAEAPVRVTFTSQGQKFLRSGEWIIKMEYGDEGEVRVYIVFGELLQMVHTQPQPRQDKYPRGPDYWKLTSAEHCYGFLSPVEEIQPGPTSWESHTNLECLWYHRDGPVGHVGWNGKSGTDQLLDFSTMLTRYINFEGLLKNLDFLAPQVDFNFNFNFGH